MAALGAGERATWEILSAPSVASATVGPGSERPPPPSAGDVCNDNCCLGLVAPPPRSGRSPSQPTVLTVKTQPRLSVGDALEARRNLTVPTSERLAEVLEAGTAALGGGGWKQFLLLGPRLD